LPINERKEPKTHVLSQPHTGAEIPGRHELTGKDEIVRHAEQNGADEKVLDVLRRIPDRQYDGSNAVSHEISEAQ
jgi:hypothetical protein